MPKPKIDYSIERHGHIGGTYRRRLNDAFEVLKVLKFEKLAPEVALIFYFLACEKLAKVMVGIDRDKRAQGVAFSTTSRPYWRAMP
jgi:hypothetical protein